MDKNLVKDVVEKLTKLDFRKMRCNFKLIDSILVTDKCNYLCKFVGGNLIVTSDNFYQEILISSYEVGQRALKKVLLCECGKPSEILYLRDKFICRKCAHTNYTSTRVFGIKRLAIKVASQKLKVTRWRIDTGYTVTSTHKHSVRKAKRWQDKFERALIDEIKREYKRK